LLKEKSHEKCEKRLHEACTKRDEANEATSGQIAFLLQPLFYFHDFFSLMIAVVCFFFFFFFFFYKYNKHNKPNEETKTRAEGESQKGRKWLRAFRVAS